jgi:ABC-type cobalamin/Fe3+-siderophores transport systems, ATPase components
MFVVGRNPNSLDGLVAVGRTSYIAEAISLAGGRNIFSDSAAAYPKISREEILSRNPEVIVDMGDMSDTTLVTEQHKRDVVALWSQYGHAERRPQSSRACRVVGNLRRPRPRIPSLPASSPASASRGVPLSSVFHLDRVGMRYGERRVLQDVSLDCQAAELIAIAGPNGAGKSTLLGVMAGLKNEYSGSCQFAGTEVRNVSRREFARQVAVVPQSIRIEFPFTASQVVLMGRTPFGDRLFESEQDQAAVQDAMRLTDTSTSATVISGR